MSRVDIAREYEGVFTTTLFGKFPFLLILIKNKYRSLKLMLLAYSIEIWAFCDINVFGPILGGALFGIQYF